MGRGVFVRGARRAGGERGHEGPTVPVDDRWWREREREGGMRGKKKRRVSVRHISPRWSRVLNSEQRATSGWDPPLRASLYLLSTSSLLRSPSIHLSILLSSPFRVLRNDSYAAMPLSKFDRTAFVRPTCTERPLSRLKIGETARPLFL